MNAGLNIAEMVGPAYLTASESWASPISGVLTAMERRFSSKVSRTALFFSLVKIIMRRSTARKSSRGMATRFSHWETTTWRKFG